MAELKTLRRCFDVVQAESLRTRLDAAGILAVVNGVESHTTLSYVGAALGGIRLEVAPEDYDRARDLLIQDQQMAAERGAWVCSRCREENDATFELCWSCSKRRMPDDHRQETDSGSEPSATGLAEEPMVVSEPSEETIQEDGNPYRPVHLEPNSEMGVDPRHHDDQTRSPDLGDRVQRAFRASILAMFMLPPAMNSYSILLLLQAPQAHVDPRYRGRVALTWMINLATIILSLLFWRSFLSDR